MSSITSAAILVAAGQGERLGPTTAGKPKQFSDLGGTPLFVWALATFASHSQIEQIVLAVPEGWQDQTLSDIAQYLPQFSQNITVIAGGNTRQESVYLALERLAKGRSLPQYIMIHDAARPFVTAGSIDQILDKLPTCCAITLGIPLSDSIKKMGAGKILEDADRNTFILVQTPQAAQFDTMLNAHRQAKLMAKAATDDASIIKSFGFDVVVLPGSRVNLKITDSEDLLIAQSLISSQQWSPGKIS
jgi:2-C-methyl-D-erythritol 4-phosphate cytidylyltransferase